MIAYIQGDLLRRGLNQNRTPCRQVFCYMENYEDFTQMENPFIGGDN